MYGWMRFFGSGAVSPVFRLVFCSVAFVHANRGVGAPRTLAHRAETTHTGRTSAHGARGESELVRVGAASSVALSGGRRFSQDMGEWEWSGRRPGWTDRITCSRGRGARRGRVPCRLVLELGTPGLALRWRREARRRRGAWASYGLAREADGSGSSLWCPNCEPPPAATSPTTRSARPRAVAIASRCSIPSSSRASTTIHG